MERNVMYWWRLHAHHAFFRLMTPLRVMLSSYRFIQCSYWENDLQHSEDLFRRLVHSQVCLFLSELSILLLPSSTIVRASSFCIQSYQMKSQYNTMLQYSDFCHLCSNTYCLHLWFTRVCVFRSLVLCILYQKIDT